MKTGSQMIGNLDGLLTELNRIRAHLADEADDIAIQWVQLGRFGGQRDDHAAALLSKLRPHLSGLATFATACVAQLDAVKADPFGRNTEGK